MIEVKSNYKNKYKNNLTCRACGLEEETQTHLLEECKAIHSTDKTKVKVTDIFCESPATLKRVAQRTRSIMQSIDER